MLEITPARPRLAEKWFTVLALFTFTGALLPFLFSDIESGVFVRDAGQADRTMWMIYSVFYLITFLLAIRSKRFLYVATRDKLLLLLVGIAFASVFWSLVPTITLLRVVALVGTMLFGVYLATRYEMNEQLRLLAWALGIAAVLSLLAGLLLPSIGILKGGARWQGIFPHPNILGSHMALSVIVCLSLALSLPRRRWVAWLGVIISITLLVLSESVTSFTVFLGVTSILLLLAAFVRWRGTLAAPALISALPLCGGLAIFFLLNADTLLSFVGRDTTLTGRTQMWDTILNIIQQHFWLGHGYGGFFLGWEGPSAQLWLAINDEHWHAHNGILDLWLDLGFIGVSVFVLGFLLNFLRAIGRMRSARDTVGLWPIAYLTFMVLFNTGETAVLEQNQIFFVLYVSTVLSLHATSNGTVRSSTALHPQREARKRSMQKSLS